MGSAIKIIIVLLVITSLSGVAYGAWPENAYFEQCPAAPIDNCIEGNESAPGWILANAGKRRCPMAWYARVSDCPHGRSGGNYGVEIYDNDNLAAIRLDQARSLEVKANEILIAKASLKTSTRKNPSYLGIEFFRDDGANSAGYLDKSDDTQIKMTSTSTKSTIYTKVTHTVTAPNQSDWAVLFLETQKSNFSPQTLNADNVTFTRYVANGQISYGSGCSTYWTCGPGVTYIRGRAILRNFGYTSMSSQPVNGNFFDGGCVTWKAEVTAHKSAGAPDGEVLVKCSGAGLGTKIVIGAINSTSPDVIYKNFTVKDPNTENCEVVIGTHKKATLGDYYYIDNVKLHEYTSIDYATPLIGCGPQHGNGCANGISDGCAMNINCGSVPCDGTCCEDTSCDNIENNVGLCCNPQTCGSENGLIPDGCGGMMKCGTFEASDFNGDFEDATTFAECDTGELVAKGWIINDCSLGSYAQVENNGGSRRLKLFDQSNTEEVMVMQESFAPIDGRAGKAFVFFDYMYETRDISIDAGVRAYNAAGAMLGTYYCGADQIYTGLSEGQWYDRLCGVSIPSNTKYVKVFLKTMDDNEPAGSNLSVYFDNIGVYTPV